EQALDARMGSFRFDTKLLSGRLAALTDWLAQEATTRELPVGYFSGGSGAAALAAAVARAEAVGAVVLHNSRPDLTNVRLAEVAAATLILVGGDEEPEMGQNPFLLGQLRVADKQLTLVPVSAQGPNQPAGLEEV